MLGDGCDDAIVAEDTVVADTARRALRVLYEVLAPVIDRNDCSDWQSIFPSASITSTCEKLLDFFAQNLPGALEYTVDDASDDERKGSDGACKNVNFLGDPLRDRGSSNIPGPASGSFDFLRRLANNLEEEHAKRLCCALHPEVVDTLEDSMAYAVYDHLPTVFNHLTSDSDTREPRFSSSPVSASFARPGRSGAMATAAAGVIDTDIGSDGATTARVRQLQASVAQKTQEVDDLEGKIFSGTLNPAEKLAAERRLKRLERVLLNETIALSIATSSSEYNTTVRKLESKVTVLSTRQDKVENRQDELEQRVEEDMKDKDREIQKLKSVVDLLLEENKARKETEASLKQAVESVQIEQRLTRKTVDVIDNRQRKQSLILHGLRPGTAKEDLASLLPTALGQAIERTHPVTKVAADGTVPVAVHFLTVSACEQARELLASDDFKKRNGGRVRCAQDESELTRVGGSRLRAITNHLIQKYGEEIEVKRDFVRFKGVKYLAAEFAAQSLKLGDSVVDIDEAVRNNPDAKENPAVRTFINGRDVVGIRLPRKRRNQDEASPPHTTRNSRRQAHNDHGRGGAHRLTNNLPIMEGQTSGGVTVWNHGHASHGGGRARDNVMRVSQNPRDGQPAYYFRNSSK
jgi:hypothetical protein